MGVNAIEGSNFCVSHSTHDNNRALHSFLFCHVHD